MGHEHHKRLIKQRLGYHIRFGKRQRHDDGYQLTVAQLLAQGSGVALFHIQRHLARQFLQMGDKQRQQIRPDGEDGTHREGAAELVFPRIGDILDGRCLLQHQIRLGHNLLTQRCRLHTGLGALKQRHTQFILQFFNGNTQGGLTDEAAIRCPPEMLLLRQGNDVAQFGECHDAMPLMVRDGCPCGPVIVSKCALLYGVKQR